jgi:hypothetical protein
LPGVGLKVIPNRRASTLRTILPIRSPYFKSPINEFFRIHVRPCKGNPRAKQDPVRILPRQPTRTRTSSQRLPTGRLSTTGSAAPCPIPGRDVLASAALTLALLHVHTRRAGLPRGPFRGNLYARLFSGVRGGSAVCRRASPGSPARKSLGDARGFSGKSVSDRHLAFKMDM